MLTFGSRGPEVQILSPRPPLQPLPRRRCAGSSSHARLAGPEDARAVPSNGMRGGPLSSSTVPTIKDHSNVGIVGEGSR